jgi:cytochrome c553
MKKLCVVLGLALATAFSLAIRAQAPADGPRYSGTALIRPADYREWVFLSSGLGMNYDPPPPGAAERPPAFTNVFVNPSSYRSFAQTGKWPDKTMLVLEIRQSSGDGSINKAGRFQTAARGMEVHVKDSRFPDGWAFFSFAGGKNVGKDAAEPLAGAAVAQCVECHTQHAAVERTFGQFYPTVLEIARQKGTLKPGF